MKIKSGLAVGGTGKGFFGAGLKNSGEVLRKDVSAKFENLASRGGGGGEIGSHTYALGALAGKKKSDGLHG